jgi:hypothetical protein
MVAWIVAMKDTKGREELMGYWRGSLEKHDKQLAVLERLVLAIEKKNTTCYERNSDC